MACRWRRSCCRRGVGAARSRQASGPASTRFSDKFRATATVNGVEVFTFGWSRVLYLLATYLTATRQLLFVSHADFTYSVGLSAAAEVQP
jgi:hypothetical protein